jgi:molecular chaperone GrpE
VLDVARHKDVTLSIPYLALYKGGDIVLSEEHTEFAWMSADEIIQNTKIGPRVKEIIQLAVERLKEREYLPDLKRMQADFSNYKKRQQESQKELAGYLIEKLVMEITPILDNFHMATQHVPADSCNTPWVMGISYIEKQLEKVLSDNGMQVIDAKEGDVFDPRMHEAISEEEKVATEGEDAPIENEAPQQQTIAKVLQKGYKIGEKVIRPTKAVVR